MSVTSRHVNKFISSICNPYNLGLLRTHLIRCNSTQVGGKILECLSNKSILRVSGKESSEFLQGIITNDMKHFEEGAANIYSLFLSIKGRVLYDTIVYKSQESGVYYIECDLQVAESLQKHLKMYRVRRKIDIEHLDGKMKVWTMFDTGVSLNQKDPKSKKNNPNLEGLIFPCGTLNNKASKIIDNIMIYEDPRLSELGFRILTDPQAEKNDVIKHLNPDVSVSDNVQSYKSFRYKIGIGEGVDDLPPGKPLPLEVNCDYLHGVSFHKGCYIGQELTARTYHTGVVRKRLMPLLFERVPDKSPEYDEKILNESGKVVGKFRGNEGIYGLGLMRITEALSAQSINVLGIPVKVAKPMWWPRESQEQILSVEGRK